MPDFIPRQDGKLDEWSKNLCLRLTQMQEELQLRPEDVDALQASQLEYASAHKLISNPQFKSPVFVTRKNDARKNLEKRIRLIWKCVQGYSKLDDGLRVILGMKPRTEKRRAVPPPTEKPLVRILGITGNTISIKLNDWQVTERRGKPRDVEQAQVFYHHGPTPPNNIDQWKYAGASTDIRFEFTIKHELIPGDQIWVAARWCNRRQTTSALSDPVRTFVQSTEWNVGAHSSSVIKQSSTAPLLEAA